MAGQFVLVYTTNPSASDVMNKKGVMGEVKLLGQVRVKQPSWDECDGMIIAIGKPQHFILKKLAKTSFLFHID